MLEEVIKTKLCSYLTSAVTATSTSFVATGLEIFLSANSTYQFDFGGHCTWDKDGLRYKISYTGTLVTDNFFAHKADGTIALGTIGTAVPELTGSSTRVITATGVIRTGASGRLYVEITKYTDLGVDSTIRSGSFLVARLAE